MEHRPPHSTKSHMVGHLFMCVPTHVLCKTNSILSSSYPLHPPHPLHLAPPTPPAPPTQPSSLDVVGLLVLLPLAGQLVDLTRNQTQLLQVEPSIHLTEPSLPQQAEQEVALVQQRVVVESGEEGVG